MRILIYGFKHAGKSTLAKRLADEMGLEFVDIDDMTQKIHQERTGARKSVRQIYEEEGTDNFRQVEREALRRVMERDDIILAGGPVHRMACEGFDEYVFLDAPEEDISERIERSGRPAFFDKDTPLAQELHDHMEARRLAYLKAMTIHTHGDVHALKERILRPRICVPIQASTNDGLCRMMEDIGDAADAIEIWLDHLEESPDFERMTLSKRHMLIAVAKTPEEGGRFNGDPYEKRTLLVQAARSCANLIDIDHGTGRDAIRSLSEDIDGAGCGIIVSHHDFERTPCVDALTHLMQEMMQDGADVYKIATTTDTDEDCLALLELLAWAKRDHPGKRIIISAMGDRGRIVRVAAPMLGSMLSFASRTRGGETAKGQMTLAQLREIQEGIWNATG